VSFYSIIRLRDLNQDIVDNLLSPNAFDIRVSHPDVDGFEQAILEYRNLPVDLLKDGTTVYSAEEIKGVLDTDPIWSDTAPFSPPDPLEPIITNLSLPLINTEVSHTLQDGIAQFMIRNRDKVSTKVAFTSGESGTKYITLEAGAVLTLPDVNFTYGVTSFKTIYLQSGIVSTIEILELFT